MAKVLMWRYSWISVLFVIFSGLDISSSNPDIYYYYKHDQLPAEHSIVRRSPLTEEGSNVHHELQQNIHITEEIHINNKTNTPVPVEGNVTTNISTSTAGGDYVTADKVDGQRNLTAANPEDVNRTSQSGRINDTVIDSYVPNGVPRVQQENRNSTLPLSTVVPTGTNLTGINMTVVVPEGISPGNTSGMEETDEADITINQFSHPVDNETLHDHNITKYERDSHQYYNSSFITNNEAVGHQYWVDMTNRTDVFVNDMLSQSHRRAATVKLSFDFPFYGHIVRNVTIATGGFLYTGEYVHSWLAATQYIAPLMANFDTSISKNSYVKYVDNGTAFTVLWEKVVLQDKPDSGDFTFQATLHSNGDIVFVYQNVPIVIEEIQDDHHPVKVGLSDAYIIDRTIFFVRRKTIYEYHRVNFNRQDIKNWTVIVLNALPTCVDLKDCDSCLSTPTNFMCNWCPTVKRCSTGTDRNRQDWLYRGCDKSALTEAAYCPANSSQIPPSGSSNDNMEGETNSAAQTDHMHTGEHSAMHGDRNVPMSISGIVGILFIIALVAGLGVWVFYAYRNPHTASGQFLIRYRPSQWSWKRGEARYTAATIHM